MDVVQHARSATSRPPSRMRMNASVARAEGAGLSLIGKMKTVQVKLGGIA